MLTAYVVHTVPGRARIRLPSKRGDALFFGRLEQWLLTCPGIVDVKTNVRAASALLVFEGQGDLAQVAEAARHHRWFRMERNPPPLKTVGASFSDHLEQLNELITTTTRGHLDTHSVFFLFFLGLGLQQIVRGNVMQPAIPMLWRALEILRDMDAGTRQ
ncbi:MAG: HMA2 domain-containing protein [Methylococcus sp.]